MDTLLKTMRALAHLGSRPLIALLRPLKVAAFQTKSSLIRGLILNLTMLVDFLLVFLNIQNETMILHHNSYRGNFIFGKAVMVTDYPSAAQNIVKPLFKGNNFMGVGLVSFDSDAFSTNSGILNQCPPIRAMTRKYIDDHIFTPTVRRIDSQAASQSCSTIIKDWKSDERMTSTFVIRSTVARIFFQLLGGVQLDKDDSHQIGFNYVRRFVELSMFSRYLPGMLELLGTRERIRRDVYLRLSRYGLDNMTVDMTLFAALFSVGTLVIRCVENVSRHGVDYHTLDSAGKRAFATESLRLYPTVTTVHRIVQENEEVIVSGRSICLQPGDEVAYPIICCNRDGRYFSEPDEFRLDRPPEEFRRVLSWSKGPHDCPGKDLSLVVTLMMLDALCEVHDLKKLKIFNPAF